MKKLLVVVNVLVIIGLAAFGVLYFKKYQDLKSNPASAEQAAQAQADKTIEEVGKLYNLPTDEKPSIASVSDKEKLKDQPFFDLAENGDITLIYQNAKLAILYRPSTKKIVNVSTVTIQSSAKVQVIGKAAARQSIEKLLTDAKIAYEDKGDAEGTYTKTVVVDLSGKNAEQAQTIATTTGGQVGQLPKGETKPEGADILVIAATE